MPLLRWLLRILAALVAIVVVSLGVWALLPARTAPIAGDRAIAAIEQVELGGFP